MGLAFLLGTANCWAQTAPTVPAQPADAMTAAVRELQDEVRELRNAVVELRSEAGEYRAQTEQLRRELQASRTAGAVRDETTTSAASATEASHPSSPAQEPSGQAPIEDRVAALEESSQLLNSKIIDQYQSKIEAASKYRIRLSGIVLLNVFSNHGSVDNQDFPTWAIPAGANLPGNVLGASLRQSEIGLEVFGPRLAGAKTTGKLQVDFSGGFTNTSDGVNLGLVRLRVANLRIDWKNTSVIAGQDEAFMSPLSPTSFASLAIPAFGYAGNLWGWIPQVRVEHRFNISEGQDITLQAGLMDNVDRGVAVRQLRAACPGGGEFRAACIRRANRLETQRFWHAVGSWNGGILQPPKLAAHESCGWLGWDDGLEHSPDALGYAYRRVLSGTRVGRTGWRGGTQRPVHRRSKSIRSVAASELGGRMVSAED